MKLVKTLIVVIFALFAAAALCVPGNRVAAGNDDDALIASISNYKSWNQAQKAKDEKGKPSEIVLSDFVGGG